MIIDKHLVLGYEIKLSSSNKKGYSNCHLCIKLSGKYPVDFEWSRWHEGCICYKIPILMDDEMMAKYQKLVARGEDTEEAVIELQKEKRITGFPSAYLQWKTNKNKETTPCQH